MEATLEEAGSAPPSSIRAATVGSMTQRFTATMTVIVTATTTPICMATILPGTARPGSMEHAIPADGVPDPATLRFLRGIKTLS